MKLKKLKLIIFSVVACQSLISCAGKEETTMIKTYTVTLNLDGGAKNENYVCLTT